ncbi:unnamed protein product [Dracunculus medinensis]|uniref:EMI domain-containing protein n=1 Tax=Dracunculus medinensis TaxID=318479 RepID=A0A0N4U929_DRAME|nr:unnamed protein product [Dracunculus medinensis]
MNALVTWKSLWVFEFRIQAFIVKQLWLIIQIQSIIFRREELSLQKHERPVILETIKPCWDITQGFRCKVKSNGTKLSYKGIPVKVKNLVKKCCLGFYQTQEATCEKCLEGFYGNNCSIQCNCTTPEICDNMIGCCEPESNSCRSSHKEYLVQATANKRLTMIMIGIVTAVAIFLFGVAFFYRKKYHKEKDPDLPTLTYYPHVKEFLPPSDIESREFNNPLYRQSIVEPVKPNTQEIDKFKTSRMEPTMNDYATLDEVSISLAGPSSTDPLLTDRKSPYEVPYSQDSVSSILEKKA